MRLFNAKTNPTALLHTGPLFAKEEKLNLFQQLQLKQAEEQKMSPEFIAVITTGYSDTGRLGLRSAREMRRIRQLLASYRMRFSCVSLLALSDESILLYACGFERGLPLRDIRLVVCWYNEEVRSIQEYHTWMGRRERKQRIMKAYQDSMNRLSHLVSAAA